MRRNGSKLAEIIEREWRNEKKMRELYEKKKEEKKANKESK